MSTRCDAAHAHTSCMTRQIRRNGRGMDSVSWRTRWRAVFQPDVPLLGCRLCDPKPEQSIIRHVRSESVPQVMCGPVFGFWVRGRLGDDWSVLLLTGVSSTMRPVSMPCVLLSEDLLLRLKPVITRTLTDASFVVLEGSCGDPFVEMCRHGRWMCENLVLFGGLGSGAWSSMWSVASSSRVPSQSSVTNQIRNGKARPSMGMGRCQGAQTRVGRRA
jgi:hypothetical protein